MNKAAALSATVLLLAGCDGAPERTSQAGSQGAVESVRSSGPVDFAPMDRPADSQSGVEPTDTTLARMETVAVRAEAIRALSEVGGEESMAAFAYALEDPDAEVRAAAIEALADTGTSADAMALVATLSHDDVRLRIAAVETVAAIGGDMAILLLQQRLGDADETVRELAADYLQELGSDPYSN